MSEDSAAVELDGVTKTYEKGSEVIRAVDDVSLEVTQGEFVCVTGPSGSGKSTMLHLIAGFTTPDDGSVRTFGREPGKLGQTALADFRRRNIGVVFQKFYLLPTLTALDNACLPLTPYAPRGRVVEAARAALERVGLGDRTAHRVSELSGGEQQRVALARALITGPELILADEPTGNLDRANGVRIFDLFAGLNAEGVTVVVATHDTDMTRYSGRVVELADGAVAAQTAC